jgi:hypothetical protein
MKRKKNYTLFLVAALLFIHLGAHAQRFDWVRFTPTTSSSTTSGEKVVYDGNGHIYTAQRFFDSVVVGSDTLQSEVFPATNFLLIKWNQLGEIIAYKTFHSFNSLGSIPELVYDSQNNHLIVTIAAASVIVNGTEYSGANPVIRFDNSFEFISTTALAGGYYNPAFCINGSLYATQGLSTTFTKTDAENNIIWALPSTSGALAVSDMASNNGSLFYAIGYFMNQQTVTYDGVSMTPSAEGLGKDIGLMQLDTNGQVLNAIRLGRGFDYTSPLKIAVDNNGFIYIASTYTIAQNIGGIDLPASTVENGVFVTKLDTDFNVLWINNFQQSTSGNMESRGLCIGPNGEVVVTGLYGGIGTFGSFNLASNSFGMCYLALLNPQTGEVTYAERYGVPTGTSRPFDIAVDETSLYSTGLIFASSENTAEFGCYNSASQYFFLTKFTNEAFEYPTISLTYDGTTIFASTNLLNADFEWMLDGEPLPDASGAQYTPSTGGIYSVSVTNYGCTSEATIQIEGVVVLGCTNSEACNYLPTANTDDGSCYSPGDPCDDGNMATTNDAYTLNCECQGFVGVEELSANEIALYPNPVSDQLHFRFNPPQDINRFQLSDGQGRILIDQLLATVNPIVSVETLATGFYFAQLTNAANEVVHRSIVIKK